ncbi:hypothetical protein ABS768_17490, partial [Flavobacterium sp. ST-75]
MKILIKKETTNRSSFLFLRFYNNLMYQNGSYGYQQPHAPRKITEYPSWVSVPGNDPRVRHKEIDYDANGNQTEIKEKV